MYAWRDFCIQIQVEYEIIRGGRERGGKEDKEKEVGDWRKRIDVKSPTKEKFQGFAFYCETYYMAVWRTPHTTPTTRKNNARSGSSGLVEVYRFGMRCAADTRDPPWDAYVCARFPREGMILEQLSGYIIN